MLKIQTLRYCAHTESQLKSCLDHGQKLIKSHESDQLPETLKKHYPKLLEEIRKMRSIICAKTRIFASSDAESILRVKKFIDWSTINYIEYGIWSFTSEGKRSHSEKREELSKLIQRYHFLSIEKIDSKIILLFAEEIIGCIERHQLENKLESFKKEHCTLFRPLKSMQI